MKHIEIFTFQGGIEGSHSSSHYFDTPDGVFLFDGQLVRDQAEALLAQIEENIPGRALKSIFITSAYPEHYEALDVLASEAGVDIYATAKTSKQIVARAGKSSRVLPNQTIRSAQQFQWNENVLEFLDIGARESAGGLACWLPAKKRLIAGDMVFNKVHPYLERVDIESWLRALDILSSYGAKTVYPGHGPVVAGDIVTHLKRYLAHFRMAVARFTGRGSELNDDLINGVVSLMGDKYPDYEFLQNLAPGVRAEYERQKGRRAA